MRRSTMGEVGFRAGDTIVDVLAGLRRVEVQWSRYAVPGSSLDDAADRRGVWARTDGGCHALQVEAEQGKRHALRWAFGDPGGGPRGLYED